MIKQIAWNTFKNTGNIDTFLEFKQVEDVEQIIKVNENEIDKNKWSSNCRKDDVRF